MLHKLKSVMMLFSRSSSISRMLGIGSHEKQCSLAGFYETYQRVFLSAPTLVDFFGNLKTGDLRQVLTPVKIIGFKRYTEWFLLESKRLANLLNFVNLGKIIAQKINISFYRQIARLRNSHVTCVNAKNFKVC